MTAGTMRIIGLLVLILAGCVATCGAATIKEWPEVIQEGDSIYVEISDLGAGQVFTTRIDNAVIDLDGRQTFEFRQNNFTMPFTLRGGGIKVEVSRAKWATLNISYPDGSTSVTRADPPGSRIVIQKNTTIPKGTYGYIAVGGEAEDGEREVTISLELNGTTDTAAARALMDFTISGIPEGSIPIRAITDAQECLQTTVWVVRPISTPITSSSGGRSSSHAAPTVEESETPTPTNAQGDNPTDAQGDLPIVVWSTDRQMFIVFPPGVMVTDASGERIDPASEIILQPLSGDDIPGFFPEGMEVYKQNVYRCIPQDVRISTPITATFPLTEDDWDAVTTKGLVMEYDDEFDGWKELQVESDPATRSVRARVDQIGTIGLFLPEVSPEVSPEPEVPQVPPLVVPAVILLFIILAVLYLLLTRKR